MVLSAFARAAPASSPTPTTTAEKATRRRDALDGRAQELRHATMSQLAQYFSKAKRLAPTAKSMEVASQKASAAAMAMRSPRDSLLFCDILSRVLGPPF